MYWFAAADAGSASGFGWQFIFPGKKFTRIALSRFRPMCSFFCHMQQVIAPFFFRLRS
jgi:hypothetical protein